MLNPRQFPLAARSMVWIRCNIPQCVDIVLSFHLEELIRLDRTIFLQLHTVIGPEKLRRSVPSFSFTAPTAFLSLDEGIAESTEAPM
jgi:hypothetical protein